MQNQNGHYHLDLSLVLYLLDDRYANYIFNQI